MRLGVIALVLGATALAGCEEGLQGLNGSGTSSTEPGVIGEGADGAPVRIVEQEVEAPDVFAVNDTGLWDGRPSLGGAWVAHANAGTPERVRVTNEENGTTVEIALFRRERDLPGPPIQVSADAARQLGLIPGQPTMLNVVALRRETVEIPLPVPEPTISDETTEGTGAAIEAAESAPEAEAEGAIEASTLDPVATAAAAIAAAEAEDGGSEAAETAAVEEPAPAPVQNLTKPYIQIGIFSVEENARNVAAALSEAGIASGIRERQSEARTIWRVVVGPVTSRQERREMLSRLRELGYSDAYAVTN
ncbi:SPOR domain-containing protein [Rhodophyticola sp. MJ-SS7]|nr:SPOR domain-containing protein [Rhodophyticola sp. MJ-SS7]